MAARKKPENQKFTVRIVVRVDPELKAKADAMAEESGVSISAMVRDFLARKVVK